MLMLTRMVGQSITIYIPGRRDPITITNCERKGSGVRLGVEADDDIRIVRTEIQKPNDTYAGRKSNRVRR